MTEHVSTGAAWLCVDEADAVLLEQDMVLYGVGFITVDGRRIDPKDVTIDTEHVEIRPAGEERT